MIGRQGALEATKTKIGNENLLKHCLAAEVVMKFLAKRLNEDEGKWSMAGLLHDIDYAQTSDNPKEHSLLGAKMLEEMDVPEDVIYAVKVHNVIHGLPRKSNLDKALYAADSVTGLIVASALITKEKKLEVLDVSFLMKRFNEKSFARGVNREQISSCFELGLDLEEFLDISLRAMKSIDNELGL